MFSTEKNFRIGVKFKMGGHISRNWIIERKIPIRELRIKNKTVTMIGRVFKWCPRNSL
jgi:hypothetical protein